MVEQLTENLSHKPPVLIRDSESAVPGHIPANGEVTAGHGGKIHLFSDALTDSSFGLSGVGCHVQIMAGLPGLSG